MTRKSQINSTCSSRCVCRHVSAETQCENANTKAVATVTAHTTLQCLPLAPHPLALTTWHTHERIIEWGIYYTRLTNYAQIRVGLSKLRRTKRNAIACRIQATIESAACSDACYCRPHSPPSLCRMLVCIRTHIHTYIHRHVLSHYTNKAVSFPAARMPRPNNPCRPRPYSICIQFLDKVKKKNSSCTRNVFEIFEIWFELFLFNYRCTNSIRNVCTICAIIDQHLVLNSYF